MSRSLMRTPRTRNPTGGEYIMGRQGRSRLQPPCSNPTSVFVVAQSVLSVRYPAGPATSRDVSSRVAYMGYTRNYGTRLRDCHIYLVRLIVLKQPRGIPNLRSGDRRHSLTCDFRAEPRSSCRRTEEMVTQITPHKRVGVCNTTVY